MSIAALMQEFDVFDAIRDPSPKEDDAQATSEELRARLVQATGESDWNRLVACENVGELEKFLRREFPRQATVYDTTIKRRAFLKLLGAGLAMAGLAACSPPQGEKILPYVDKPERIVPGLPLYYTTAMTLGGYGMGLLVRSDMGRPTKVEGNPKHPASLGATDIFAQGSLFTLYDPVRSQVVLENGKPSAWASFQTALANSLKEQGSDGSGFRVLTPALSSPTLGAQLQTLLTRFPGAQWHQYEPFNEDNVRAGSLLAFGEIVQTRYDLTRAQVILALDSDFLNSGGGSLRYARDFAMGHQVQAGQSTMSRLYAVESTPGLTGTQADNRLAMRASQIAAFARAVAAGLGIAGVPAGPLENVPSDWIPALVSDLQAHRGSSLVIAGDGQPPYVHALAHLLNDFLGNVGSTVNYTDSVIVNPTDELTSLHTLTGDMRAGRVTRLLILGGNPVFDAPVDFGFQEELARVPFSVHLGLYANETAQVCTWHLPEAHFLEAWSDTRAFDGTATVMQPLIAPLYGGITAHQLLSELLDPSPRTSDAIVKAYWQERSRGNFEDEWRTTLATGVVADTALSPRAVTLNTGWLGDVPPEIPLQSYEVAFCPDPTVLDGSFAPNAWLQELPKPFTKLTWDNIVALSPTTAQRMGFNTTIAATGGEHGQVETDLVEINYGGRRTQAAVWIMPGHADDMVTLYAGYGMTGADTSDDSPAYNAYALRTSDAPWMGTGLELTPLHKRTSLATTQFHSNMEGRDLVKHTTLDAFLQDPDFAHQPEPALSLFPPQNQEPPQWGMAINLNTCIGCNACVVACQAENNIPTVGRAEVLRAREMHWLRIDRYYEGEGSALQTFHEPIPCMHCEYAPCELVCPVAATTHSPDGLNEMTYNRCVGTRYCSNNCPYKVRRFNFFQFADWETPSLKPMRNPEVTVRSRGVMEKCTYCVQRIKRAKTTAEIEDRPVRDGEIVTACQAVCPTQAIVFGDVADPKSRVSQLKADSRNYVLLAELNTRPRTSYLAIVRNPNPEIQDKS